MSCVTDADCNDGGPCADRRCAGGGCVYQPLVGFPGMECELGHVLAAQLCAPEAIDPTLQRVITRRIAKAQSLVQKAASRMDRKSVRIRLLKGAARNLRVVQRRADKALRKGRISPACGEQIDVTIKRLRESVLGVSTDAPAALVVSPLAAFSLFGSGAARDDGGPDLSYPPAGGWRGHRCDHGDSCAVRSVSQRWARWGLFDGQPEQPERCRERRREIQRIRRHGIAA